MSIDERIQELLTKGEYSTRQIVDLLQLKGISSRQLTQRLSKMKDIQINKKGRVNLYSLNASQKPEQLSLDIAFAN